MPKGKRRNPLAYVNGYKTYICVCVGIAYSIAIARGWAVSNDLIWTAIVGGSALSFRNAIQK